MKDLFHLSILTFLLFAEVWCHFCNEVETLPYIVTILLLACHLGGSQQGLIGDAPLITAYAEGTLYSGFNRCNGVVESFTSSVAFG